METLNKFFAWIKSIGPIWLRALLLVLFAAILFIMTFTSCGASKSTVRVYNRADSTTTTVSVSNGDGGSTTVNVTPSIQIDSTKIM